MNPKPFSLAIETRLPRRCTNKIKRGGGKNAIFASVIAGKEAAIISYLFDKESSTARPSREQSFLKEIQENELANKSGLSTAKEDKYLNLTAYGQFLDNQRRPGIKPPWGQLHAINLNTGEFEWSSHLEISRKVCHRSTGNGASGSAGPLLTKGGLLFIGSTRDRKFRAFDQKTGEKFGRPLLPGIANANPSIRLSKGKTICSDFSRW